MKRFFLVIGILILSLASGTQEIQHEAAAINIEVPVRVYNGSIFIDDLSIDDFEVYEEGVLQKIEAVYLIHKTEIKRKEEKETKFSPNPSRTFVLMFEIIEYLPRIGEVLDHFFSNVIEPGDSLIVSTPGKTYNLNSQALERVPPKEIAKQLKGKLRQDAMLANSEYRSILRHIQNVSETDMPGLDKKQVQLDALRKIKILTYFDEKKATDFADFLKEIEGQKQVFFFFQKKMIPIPQGFTVFDRFDMMDDISLDIEKLKHSFSDSSISCHFLYITKAIPGEEGKRILRMERMESSMDSFRGFSEMAEVTGGLIDSSANAAASFRRAVDYSENYYLIYYTPQNYISDGKYRNLEVKVKGKKYKITHRAGYIAD